MASNKTNRVEVPEAKAAMDRFKTDQESGRADEISLRTVKKNDPSEYSGGLFFGQKSCILHYRLLESGDYIVTNMVNIYPVSRRMNLPG